MVMLRVPYPMGFYAKGMDGRIDDPNAGWKGRGLWSSAGDRTPWLKEGGKGSKPLAVHIQVRPDPLGQLILLKPALLTAPRCASLLVRTAQFSPIKREVRRGWHSAPCGPFG